MQFFKSINEIYNIQEQAKKLAKTVNSKIYQNMRDIVIAFEENLNKLSQKRNILHQNYSHDLMEYRQQENENLPFIPKVSKFTFLLDPLVFNLIPDNVFQEFKCDFKEYILDKLDKRAKKESLCLEMFVDSLKNYKFANHDCIVSFLDKGQHNVDEIAQFLNQSGYIDKYLAFLAKMETSAYFTQRMPRKFKRPIYGFATISFDFVEKKQFLNLSVQRWNIFNCSGKEINFKEIVGDMPEIVEMAIQGENLEQQKTSLPSLL